MVFFGSSSGLSLLFGSLPCLYFLIFFLFPFSPLLLWFSFLFSFVGPCLVFLIACALVLSLGAVVLHKCLSAFCPPLFSVPLVISPLAFLPFLRSSCGYLFCPFSYGVFNFSTPSFGGFGLLHSPAYSSPSACSLGVPGTVPLFSLPPVSRLGGGVVYVEFCTGIASGSYRCFFSLHCLATSVCASSCGSFFLSSCFPASGCLRVLSPDSSLLPSSSLTWPVSSAPGLGSLPLVSVVPCYLRCSAWRSVIVCCLCLLCSYWLLCGSLWLCLSAV